MKSCRSETVTACTTFSRVLHNPCASVQFPRHPLVTTAHAAMDANDTGILCILLAMILCYVPVVVKGIWLSRNSREKKIDNVNPRGQVVSVAVR